MLEFEVHTVKLTGHRFKTDKNKGLNCSDMSRMSWPSLLVAATDILKGFDFKMGLDKLMEWRFSD